MKLKTQMALVTVMASAFANAHVHVKPYLQQLTDSSVHVLMEGDIGETYSLTLNEGGTQSVISPVVESRSESGVSLYRFPITNLSASTEYIYSVKDTGSGEVFGPYTIKTLSDSDTARWRAMQQAIFRRTEPLKLLFGAE